MYEVGNIHNRRWGIKRAGLKQATRHKVAKVSMNTAVHLLSVLALLLGVNVTCQSRNEKWRGIIKEYDGIVSIYDPKDPINRKAGLEIEEELSIGRGDGSPECIFSRIGGIDVDAKGNIYIVDIRDAHVRVFDNRGGYIRTIGRSGEGTGELQYPVFVKIMEPEKVLIYDYAVSRMLYYSLDGVYQTQKTILQPILPLGIDSRGYLIGLKTLAPPPRGGRILYRYDPGFRSSLEIAKEEMGMSDEFDIGKPSCYCALTPSDMIIWGTSENYLINVINPQGMLIRKIMRNYEPQAITSKDKELFKKQFAKPLKAGMKIKFRDQYPAFGDILVDDEERTLVRTYEHDVDRGGVPFYDIYNRDGIFIAKISVEININKNSVWKKGRLYIITSDEDGVQMVKRYRVTWKNMKDKS